MFAYILFKGGMSLLRSDAIEFYIETVPSKCHFDDRLDMRSSIFWPMQFSWIQLFTGDIYRKVL